MKKRKKITLICVAAAAVIGATTIHGLYTAGINFAGPLKDLGIKKITKSYDPAERSGEIVFYGASNFTRWKTMEKDISAAAKKTYDFIRRCLSSEGE